MILTPLMKNKLLISWVLQIVVATVLSASAIAKFQGHPTSLDLFEILGMEPEGRYLIASLEVFAALLLIIPQSVPWGAILGWGVMSGALIAHGTKIGIHGVFLPVTVMALINWFGCLSILFLRKHQIVFIAQMFESR